MKKFMIFLIGILIASYAHSFCNWGFAGPKPFKCNGLTYVYGTAACDDGIYKNVFCRDSESTSGRSCMEDNDPQTVTCYNKIFGQNAGRTETPRQSVCNWGYVGPKIVRCNGQNYCFGSQMCGSTLYSNVMCKESLCNQGTACADDNSDETVSCYRAYSRTVAPTGTGRIQSSSQGGIK